jgi:hypothetical protein
MIKEFWNRLVSVWMSERGEAVVPGSPEDLGIEPTAEPTPEPGAEPTPEPGAESEPEPGAEPEILPAEEPLSPREQAMADRLEKLEKALETKAEPQPEPAKGGGFTPEFSSQLQKDFGFTRVKGEDGQEVTSISPEQFAKGMFNAMGEVLKMARDHAESLVHGTTSEIRVDSVISDMAVKTPDIRRYAPQIKEYLKKRYSPKDHSNPDYIMDGYYRAKGMGPTSPAPASDRSKVRIMTPAPSNRPGKPVAGKPLGPVARKLIESGQFKDEAEYRAWAGSDVSKLQ